MSVSTFAQVHGMIMTVAGPNFKTLDFPTLGKKAADMIAKIGSRIRSCASC